MIIAKTVLSIGTALEGNSPVRFALSFETVFGLKLEFPHDSQLAKLKRVFLSCLCHEIYRVEAVCQQKISIILKKLHFLLDLEQFLDILPITA